MTSCDLHPAIRNYIDIVQSGEHRVCPEQEALAERLVAHEEKRYVDDDDEYAQRYSGELSDYHAHTRYAAVEYRVVQQEAFDGKCGTGCAEHYH